MIVKLIDEPTQPFEVGVTVIVAICVTVTLFVVKFRLPIPDAASPILVFEFVQLKIGFEVPEKGMLNDVPPQAIRLPGLFMVGAGLTVILKFFGVPKQAPSVGLTVIIPTC